MIIGYFIIRAFPFFFGRYIDTETVVREVFVDKIETKGIVLKDEFVYTDDSSGIELEVKEGDRVRKGESLARNTSSETTQKNTEKIDLLELEISKYRLAYTEYDAIIEGTVESSISDYTGENRELFSKDEMDLIVLDLEQKARSSEAIFERKLVELESQKEILKRGMQESMVAVFPGVISYNVDGIEGIYDFKAIMDFSIQDYENLENKVKGGKDGEVRPGLKLVENNTIYIAIKLDKIHEKDLESRERLELEFLDEELRVLATIKNMVSDEESVLLILEVTEGIHRLQNERYPRLGLVKGSYDGLKVPSSAITENSGNRGVYIRDISGVVRFVPVRLLYKGQDYSIVNEDDTIEIKRDGEKLEERGLRVFDEVFVNSILVREGQIID